MFKFRLQLSDTCSRDLTSYSMPVVDGDVVKVRETHPGTKDSARKNERGKVVGQMHMISVQFEDGTVETFNRDELSLRLPEIENKLKEPWQG